jgi:polysaccharide biosynthesis/export protein
MRFGRRKLTLRMAGVVALAIAALGGAGQSSAQGAGTAEQGTQSASPYQQTTDDYNQRLADINRRLSRQVSGLPVGDTRADYRIGPDDQLDIAVLEAAELDRAPRVSASGEISLGLVGTVRAAGLTARELEIVIEELLRRSYIKEPHVSVQVREMQSHPVSVFGAVKKPGVFQIRGPKTVVELLSMAEGLDVNAGDTVIV